jgi:hypothetical protein
MRTNPTILLIYSTFDDDYIVLQETVYKVVLGKLITIDFKIKIMMKKSDGIDVSFLW